MVHSPQSLPAAETVAKSDTPSIPGSGKHRTRIRQACGPCRKRRRKCDGALPCGQCEFYGYRCRFSRASSSSAVREAHSPPYDNGVGAAPPPNKTPIRRSDSSSLPGTAGVEELQKSRIPKTQDHGNVGRLLHLDQSGRDWPFFDPIKGRYCRASGSIAFTKLVSSALPSKANLRLHSYGWNVNIRSEAQPSAVSSIRSFLTFQEMSIYSDRFFSAVNPNFLLINQSRYYDRSSKYWASRGLCHKDFEALVSGVVSIGSVFAENPSMAESQLVEHAKAVLDTGTCYAPGRMSLDQVAAWVLRTLYLRLTTRPNIAWLASCTTVHVAEAMALHVDLNYARLPEKELPAQTLEFQDARRNLYHAALFLNTTISLEYGRSRITPDSSHGQGIPPDSALMSLTRLAWETENALSKPARFDLLKAVAELPTEQPLHQLLKIDVALYLYRKHIYLDDTADMTGAESKLMLSLFRSGFSITCDLALQKQPWWSIVSTPFQTLLVLLAIDTDESLTLVQECMNVLKVVADSFRASLPEEALQTAQLLVRSLNEKKNNQSKLLIGIDDFTGTCPEGILSVPAPTWEDGTEVGSSNSVMADSWLFGEEDWLDFANGNWTGSLEFANSMNIP